jgi:hypothetical protein
MSSSDNREVAELLSILACPKCKGGLTLPGDRKILICDTCHVSFPIREGVPVLLMEEGTPIGAGSSGLSGGSSSHSSGNSSAGEKAIFSIVEGKNKGETIEVEKGICRALGRSLDDMERTKVFSAASSMTLDEASKKLVMQYISKQFHKGESVAQRPGVESIGDFVRGPDCQIRDLAVSRLHAMLFHDESGVVGILDLVSRNGTFVNGTEVESKVLKTGDLITIGGTKIRFES